MATVFFTGFPGFLGTELLPRVMKRQATGVTATCLVQSKFKALAQSRADELSKTHPELAGRIRLLEGDITRADLGLGDTQELREEVIEVFHLAAVYDLAVRRDLAMKVNVDGTRYVADFARACPHLKRFHYVSTCYVSGKYAGAYTEYDLEKGQEFNNFYEETKYLAEVEVQRRMREGMPSTIYRPAIVVGDSATGATQKYDGPYFVVQWLLRQPGMAVMPVVGDPRRTRVNVVPRDFVVNAIAHLSGLERSLNKVYQLCDPNPPTAQQMMDVIGRATGKNMVRLPLPTWLARNALAYGPGVYKLMKIPAEALDYFVHPTFYTCNNTLADLEGSGLRCPSFPEYASRLVNFMREHPEISASAMV
ncbi:MAG: SDR family oxidoreductase [Deltaproteobacteria bacterium]|nr:SDR family oxidoreductase [Deltaproteobacteria bacterium]